jgi:hypothetical protein
VPGGEKRLIEAVLGEVDGHELDLAGSLRKPSDARALLALRVGMIHLEHNSVAELGHSPGSTVEPRAQDDDLGRGHAAHGVVDRDRTHDHHFRSMIEKIVIEANVEAVPPPLPRAKPLHPRPGLLGQKRQGGRVGKPRDRAPAMRGGAPHANEHGGLTCASCLHRAKV